jgi:hypothetical protein
MSEDNEDDRARAELVKSLCEKRETFKVLDTAMRKLREAGGFVRNHSDLPPEQFLGLLRALLLMYLGEVEAGVRVPSSADRALAQWDDEGIDRDVLVEVIDKTGRGGADRDELCGLISDAHADVRRYEAMKPALARADEARRMARGPTIP